MTTVVDSIRGEFLRYKDLGEKAIDQLPDEALSRAGAQGGNSIATLVWHISGAVARDELLEKWNDGWNVLTETLASLTDTDLERTIAIRSQSMTVVAALHRSLAHISYHIGQIVYIAKSIRADDWNYLSIPPGKSDDFNRRMMQK